MLKPGIVKILIIPMIIVLLFGPGRISKISKEIGSNSTT